jgi:hypothetical protein
MNNGSPLSLARVLNISEAQGDGINHDRRAMVVLSLGVFITGGWSSLFSRIARQGELREGNSHTAA